MSIVQKPKKRWIDVSGKVFARVTALEYIGTNSRRDALWACLCQCGRRFVTTSQRLRHGFTKSCGCLKVERIVRHGQSGGPLYACWQAMLQRCFNPKCPGYDRYGGRGITVCERWENSFEAFCTDMGPRPSPKHSIDRINNNGNYEPGNCRWATSSMQCGNMSTTILVSYAGKTQSLRAWAKEFGMPYMTLHQRYRVKGMSFESAVLTPRVHGGHGVTRLSKRTCGHLRGDE